jgi:endonuclease YncB( thermonuclease family)
MAVAGAVRGTLIGRDVEEKSSLKFWHVIVGWFVLCGFCAWSGHRERTRDAWWVTRIIDGDTIEVEREGVTERVRLLGIDAPEHNEPGFAASRDHLDALLSHEGRWVRLEFDSTQPRRDRYGRLLCYVYRAGGSECINALMIEDGKARVYHEYPCELTRTYGGRQ